MLHEMNVVSALHATSETALDGNKRTIVLSCAAVALTATLLAWASVCHSRQRVSQEPLGDTQTEKDVTGVNARSTHSAVPNGKHAAGRHAGPAPHSNSTRCTHSGVTFPSPSTGASKIGPVDTLEDIRRILRQVGNDHAHLRDGITELQEKMRSVPEGSCGSSNSWREVSVGGDSHH